MRAAAFCLSLCLTFTPLTAYSGICAYGFNAGNGNVTKIRNIVRDFLDAKPNIMVLFSTNTDVTTNAQEVLVLLNEMNSFGGKGIIDLADVAFNRVAPGLADCSDYGGGGVTGPDAYQLRADYRSRLTSFFNHSTDFSNFSKVFAISIHTEANNNCVEQADIESISDYIKNTLSITSVPLAVGYGHSDWPLGGYNEKDLPSAFPADTDMIAFWDYGMFNPLDPADPLNGSSDFNTRWTTIKGKLGSRKVLWAVNSWCDTPHESASWTPDCDIQEPLTTNEYLLVVPTHYWALWALDQPEVIGLIGFEYDFGAARFVKDMPIHITWIKNLIKAQDCTYTFP